MPDEARELIAGANQPDRDVGGALLRRNYLSRAALSSILRSAVVDAVTMLTVPMEAGSFVSDLRLAVPDAHWAGTYSRLRAADVWVQARGWVARTARHRVARTALVELCDLGVPSAIVRREEWAIACAITGAMSAQGIAWRYGLALCDVIEQVSLLLEVGLCALVPGPALAGPPRPGPALAGPPRPAAGLAASLPHRPQGAGPAPIRPVMSAQVAAGDGAPPDSSAYTPSPPELLRRVLDGLKNMS